MQSEQAPCLLVIISDISVRDALADHLLSYQDELVFSSAAIDCHGIDPESLNLAEQVSGRQRKYEFQIQTSLAMARDINRSLASAFPRANLRYWIQPVIEAGHLDSAGDERRAVSD